MKKFYVDRTSFFCKTTIESEFIKSRSMTIFSKRQEL